MNDPRRRAIDVVAHGLRDGFLHPGDPENNVPPTPVLIPLRPRPGQPAAMSDLLEATITLLSESIVNDLITKAGLDLVERTEVQTLRRRLGDGRDAPELIPVHCRCDVRRERPLAILTIESGRGVIDGPTVLSALRAVSPECPHRWATES